jgi:hypothetical protein
MRIPTLMIVTFGFCATAITGVLAEVVEITTDPVGYDCRVFDNTTGLQDLYVRYLGNGTNGARFKLEASPGVTMTYLSEEYYAPVLEGDTQSGITFCLADCVPEALLAKVTYMRHGTSTFCSAIDVVPHPSSNTIEVHLCVGTSGFAYGSGVKINPTECLPCGEWDWYGPTDNPSGFCEPILAEPTTWGRIKSLYQ